MKTMVSAKSGAIKIILICPSVEFIQIELRGVTDELTRSNIYLPRNLKERNLINYTYKLLILVF